MRHRENAFVVFVSFLLAIAMIITFVLWRRARGEVSPIETELFLWTTVVSIIWLLIVKSYQYIRR